MIQGPTSTGLAGEHGVTSKRHVNLRWLIGACLVAFFALGAAADRFVGNAVHNYLGVSVWTVVRSPLSYWRIHQRGWNVVNTLHYTQDTNAVSIGQSIETILLPLSITGKRLSDSYAVPKMGGAIAVIGKAIFILDRLGGMYRYDLTDGSFSPLKTVPPLPNNVAGYLNHRPGGPVNLADAPNDEFRSRDIIYLPDRRELAASYDKFDDTTGKIRTAVSVIPFDIDSFAATGSWREVFVSDAFAPFVGITSGAGMLAYRKDGKLYVSIGDHYIVSPKVSEDPNSSFGKIIEIDLPAKTWRVFSQGHRNPEGLTFTRAGVLLATEHGPRGGDKLDVITEGSDYGWPNVSLGTEYNSYNWSPGAAPVGTLAGYKAPLFAWVPSIAPTQVIEVGHFNPRWNGDLLVATLKASSLYRLRLQAGRVLYCERIWIGDRIRDLAETDDGRLVFWTDDTKLLFVSVDKDQLVVDRRMPTVVGAGIVKENCLGCHHFGPTSPTDFAPSLSNLLNRPIASDTFSYSPALKAKRKLGRWTPELLTEFLSDPFKFASGTNMLPLAVSPGDIKDIVANLSAASGQHDVVDAGR